MHTVAQPKTPPPTPPASTKPDPLDCCVTCGQLLDADDLTSTLWIFFDGRGAHEWCL